MPKLRDEVLTRVRVNLVPFLRHSVQQTPTVERIVILIQHLQSIFLRRCSDNIVLSIPAPVDKVRRVLPELSLHAGMQQDAVHEKRERDGPECRQCLACTGTIIA
jgi:hypothetical protein